MTTKVSERLKVCELDTSKPPNFIKLCFSLTHIKCSCPLWRNNAISIVFNLNVHSIFFQGSKIQRLLDLLPYFNTTKIKRTLRIEGQSLEAVLRHSALRLLYTAQSGSEHSHFSQCVIAAFKQFFKDFSIDIFLKDVFLWSFGVEKTFFVKEIFLG